MRRTVGRIYVGLLVAFVICLTSSVVCLADGCKVDHKPNMPPRNAYERWAAGRGGGMYGIELNPSCSCNEGNIGSIWIAKSPGQYFGVENLDVDSDDQNGKMHVYVMGSLYGCGHVGPVFPPDATNVCIANPSGGMNGSGYSCIPDPKIIKLLHRSSFSRGYPGVGTFSSSNDAIPAELDVDAIQRELGGKTEGYIVIYIGRTYNHGGPGVAAVPIHVKIRDWQIYVNATVSQPTATPGDTVTFTFSGLQGGPGKTNKVVNFYDKVDGSTGRHLATWPKGTPSGTTGGPWVERRYITQQDVGKRVCGTITAQPSSLRSDAPVSATACVEVPYNWHSELSTKAKSDSPVWNESKNYDINHGGMYPNVYPKDKLTWWHQANFIGPTRAQQDVNFFSHSTLAGHGSDPIGYKNQYWGYGNGAYSLSPKRVFNFEGARGQMNSYEVEQDDVTHDICEYFSAHPGYGYGMPWGLREGDTRSNQVCFHVPYHYIPEPPGHGPTPKDCLFYGSCPGHDIPGGKLPGGLLVSTNRHRMTKDRVLLGDPVAFDSVITHNGGRTKSKPYRYESYAAIIRGDAINDRTKRGPLIYPGNGFNNPEFNCTIKGKTGEVHRVNRNDIKYCFTVCNNTRGGSGSCATDMLPLGLGGINKDKSYNDQFDVSMFNAARPDPGDKICYWAAVTNWAAIDDDSAKSTLVSNMTCIDIAKQPQLKIVGGDTIAGGSIRGSSYNTVNPINNDRGSWSQYGLFANGEINDFGSAGFSTAYIANILNSCRLDYANKIGLSTGGCDINKMGHFGAKSDGYSKYVPHVPDIDHSKFEDVYSDTIDLSSFKPYAQRAINYLGVSALRITGNLPRGARVVIDAVKGAQIDIVGNITASEGRGYERLSDIPSLTVLTDNNINIARNVTELFGNYISRKGKIYTCADSKADSDSDAAESDKLGVISVCNQRLRVRGALISAGDIVFHRTYGSDNFNEKTRSLPSEEIDYTPNTFLLPLSNLTTVNDSITYRIVNANMLAPRF